MLGFPEGFSVNVGVVLGTREVTAIREQINRSDINGDLEYG